MSAQGKDYYEGPYVNGKREGEGTYYFKSGNIYKGYFESNERHGLGRITFPNQEFMEGTWSKGVLVEGYFMYLNENYYKGPFLNSKFASGGIFFFKDKGLYYVGEYKDNNFSGKGRLIWAESNTLYYEGNFQDDEIWGHGELYVPNTFTVIKGLWEGEKKVKNAEIFENEVKKYTVDIVNGALHGKGKFFQEELGVWGEGKWEKNQLKEVYKYYFKQNEYIEGVFDKNLSGNGQFCYEDESKYNGTLVNGKRSGLGKMVYGNKDEYNGGFLDGLRKGKGIYKFYKGIEESLDGEWEAGVINGKGVLKYRDGSVFEGDWFRGNKKSGKLRFKNQDEFEGNFLDNDVVVKGVYKFKSGEWFEGSLVNWKKDGEGVYYYSKVYYIKGYWVNDLLEDTVQIFFADKSQFQGTFEKNFAQGQGIHKFPSTSIYASIEAIYSQGKKNGPGKITFSDQSTMLVFWNNDQISGQVEYTNDNYYFKGDWKNSKKNGKGEENYDNGDRYYGNFMDNQREGFGKYTFKNNSIYEGYFKNGHFDGNGKLTYANKDTYEGNFENGYRSGPGTYYPSKENKTLREPVKGYWSQKGTQVNIQILDV